jgi:hypothetical protein
MHCTDMAHVTTLRIRNGAIGACVFFCVFCLLFAYFVAYFAYFLTYFAYLFVYSVYIIAYFLRIHAYLGGGCSNSEYFFAYFRAYFAYSLHISDICCIFCIFLSPGILTTWKG